MTGALDFERGATSGAVNMADGRLEHLAGTVRPLD